MFQFLNANGRLGQAGRLEDTITEPLKPYSSGAELFSAAQDTTLTSMHPLGVEYDVNKLAFQELAETNPEAKLAYETARRRGQFARGRLPAQPDQYTTKYTDRQELKSLMAEAGLDFNDEIKIPAEGLSLSRAKVFQRRKEEQIQAEMVLANAEPGFSQYASTVPGSLAAGILDPINLIPFGGQVAKAGMAVKSGTKIFSAAGMRTFSRAAGRAALENMAATAAVDSMSFPYANKWGAGLGFEQAAADITMGGLLGGMLGAAGHVIGRWSAARLHTDLLLKTALDDEAGRAIDLSRVVGDRLEQAKRNNPSWNKGIDSITAESKLKDFLITSEQMKTRRAETDASRLISEVQAARTGVETNIAGLKESVLDIRNEMAVHESTISQAGRRSADTEIFAAEQVRELEVRRDVRADDARAELEQRIQYIRKNEPPADIERSMAEARAQAESVVADIYRDTQWQIEGIRSQVKKEMAVQAERGAEARARLEEIRTRHIEAIDGIRSGQQELNKIDKRVLELKRSAVTPDAKLTGGVSLKVLGEPEAMVQARERIKTNRETLPSEAKTGGTAEEPIPPNAAETAYQEGLAERLDLSESQMEELKLAKIEHNEAMKMREALDAAVECITRSGF